jgi:hypothetical protein
MGEPRDRSKRAPVQLQQRVLSPDYGRGTVIALAPNIAHVRWDKPYVEGGNTRTLVHDLRFVESLEVLADEDKP